MRGVNFDVKAAKHLVTTSRWVKLSVPRSSSFAEQISLEDETYERPRLCWGEAGNDLVEHGYVMLPCSPSGDETISLAGRHLIVSRKARPSERRSSVPSELEIE